ncbi:bacterial Ig-like domain-containing protein [Pseudoscourfieldia marina]
MIRCVLLLATAAVANAVDIAFSTATAPGAANVIGTGTNANYYTTGSSLTFNWQTYDITRTNLVLSNHPAGLGNAGSVRCYCRLRASQLTFSPAFDFTADGTEDILGTGQDLGRLVSTAAEQADSGLEAYGSDWSLCSTAGASSHTKTYPVPDGYYAFSVTCEQAGTWTVAGSSTTTNDGATNWLVKVDNVAPSSAITHIAGQNSYDPSPNSGLGWGVTSNGVFDFTLSFTDFYGTANGAPYTAVQTTADKANCAASTNCEISGVTYQCAVDNGAYAACTGSFSTTSLKAGQHVVRVRATDKAGNLESTPAFYSFSVRPHAKNAGCTFRYDLDSAGYSSLGTAATKTLSSLADGSHTFAVLAVDSTANVGTAQSFTWTVDTTPPTTVLTKTWSAQGNPTSTMGDFEWSFSEAGSYSKYSTDGTMYTMPATVTSMKVSVAANTFPIGARTFKVYGVDLLGNAGAVVTDSFTVEPIDTMLSATSAYDCTGVATAALKDTSVTFTIEARIDQNPAVSDFTYMYKLDSGSWKQGVHFPAFGIKGLSEGVHQIEAKVYTSGGTVDPTPSCKKFIIDKTDPVTTITAPGASSQGSSPTFGGKVTDANIQATGGTTYRVEKVGDSSFSITGSVATAADGSFTITLSSQTDGLYRIFVRHQDMAQNSGAETMVEWTVDTQIPNTMVSSGPATPTASTAASFLLACDESPCTYKYKVDSAESYTTSSTARLNLSDVAPGVHTIEVHAIDVAGNEDPSAAAYTWTVYEPATYESFEKSSSFEMTGPSPLEYAPPPADFVHLDL